MAQRIDAASLLDKPLLHHLLNAPVDAVEKLLPRQVQTNLYNSERPLLHNARAQRRVRLSRLQTDFHRMRHALHIVQVNLLIVYGVEPAQLLTHSVGTILGKPARHVAAHAVAYRGQLVDALTHCVDIHHRTSAHHHIVVGQEQASDHRQRVLLKLRGAVVFVQTEDSDKVMAHSGKLVGCRGGSPDGNVTKNLARVRRHDFRAEVTRQTYGNRRFSHPRGSSNHYESFLRHTAFFFIVEPRVCRFPQPHRLLSPLKESAQTHSGRGSSVHRQRCWDKADP